jgi:hypothetical protein
MNTQHLPILAPGISPALGFLLQSDRMNLEQLGGLFEGEGTRRGDLLAGARDSRLALTRSKVPPTSSVDLILMPCQESFVKKRMGISIWLSAYDHRNP